MKTTWWLSSLLMLPLLSMSGCLVGAVLFGGAAAFVIKEGFIDDDTYMGIVKTDPDHAYTSSVDVMDRLCHKIVMERAERKVSGSWRNSDLKVSVEAMEGGKVAIHVEARKYMLADKETALEVFQRILQEIKGWEREPPEDLRVP